MAMPTQTILLIIRCIRPDNSIEHRDVHGNILVQVTQ